MGDYFEEEMDTGPDTAGIVIDDYDGYDEEYFEDDAGTFSQEDEKPPKLGGASSDRLASRLSVDAPPCSAATSANSVAASEFQKDKAGSVTEEVEEIEEEVIEEEEEEEEYERFNRTEVADSRSSVLNRLGPRLGGVADSSTPPAASEHEQPAADTASAGSAGRTFPSGQCIGVAKRLIFISNLPVAVTPQQVLAHLRCILVGQMTIELFDGVYNGCCVMGLSTTGAVRQMVANIAKTPFLGRKIFAKQMQPLDHEMFMRYKMAAQPSSDTDLNALWVVVLHNVSLSTVEVVLRTAMLEEVPLLRNVQLIRKNKKGNQLALVVAPSKQVADSVANAWHERVVDGHQLKTCPLYRGYRRAASGNPGPPLVCTRSDEANKAAGAVSKPQAQQKQAGAGGGQKVAPCTTTKMNNMHELMQHTKGHACRVNVLNVAYSATEDDVIEAVNAKVGGLQYILPFRNNQGCFNGNMLLEFVTPAAAKKFFTVMQKFVLKQRQIFLRMDTDAPRDLQGNVLSDRAKSKSSVESPFGKPPFDGPPQSMRHDLPGIGPPADVPIANYGHPLPPIHPMDCGPVGHEIPPVIDFNGPASSLIGARLEPMLPPAPPALPPAPFSEPVHETYGLSPDYLANLNVELPLVPKVLISNVDPRASENDVGDLLSVAGTVVTVQINRHLQQAIVEMAHPVEAVEAISRLNHHPLHEQRIAVRLCRRRDFEIVNGLPVTEDIQLAPDVGPNPGMPYAFGQTPPNHLANPMLPMQERPLPPPGGHNFRGPTDAPYNAVQSDDLRSSLSRPGFPGRRYPSPPAVARGDVPRDSSSILSKKLDPPIEENSGFGRGGESVSTRGRGNLAGTPFWHSRGGLGFSAMSRGNPVKSVAGSSGDKPVGQASSAAGRGAANAPSTRGASNTSSGRGQTPFGRGGNNTSAGALKTSVGTQINVQAGRGAANSAVAGRGAANSAVAGRGAANSAAAGRGAANSAAAGRGAANSAAAGRGAANSAAAGRGAANSAAADRGAANSAAAGRGAANSAAVGRGAANSTVAGRGAANSSPASRGAANSSPAGRGAANSSPAGRGAANISPAGRRAANISPAGRGAANSSPASRGAANSSPAGRGAVNSSPVGRGAANSSPVGRGAANSSPVGRGAANSSPAGRGAANSSPAGRGAANSSPAGRGTANSSPAGRGAAVTAPAGRGAAVTAPAGREAAVTAPAGREAAVTAPAGRGAANSSPAGRGAANSSPAGRGAANSSPAGRGTEASSNFAGVGKETANNVPTAVGSGRNSVFGGDVNGGSAGKEPASSAFSNKVSENSVNRNSVTNAPGNSGSKDGVDAAGVNATPTEKGIALNSTRKPATVASFSSRKTAPCLTSKDGSVGSSRTEIETSTNRETSAATLAGTGAAIAALANRGTMPNSVDGAMGMNSTSRGVSNYGSFGGKSSPSDSAREKTNIVSFVSKSANTSVNKDSSESVVSSIQAENVARELSNASSGSLSNFDSPYMKAKSNDSVKERSSIVPGFAGSASSSRISNQTERNNSFHRTANFTAGRDKINISNDGSRDVEIPVIGKEIGSAGPSDKEKAYPDTRPVVSKTSYQSYGGRDMVERDSQVHRSDDLNANYGSQIAGISPITVVMDAATERKPFAKHSEHHGIASGNVSANFNPVRDFPPDSGSNAVSNSSFSSGGVWRSGSAVLPKQIDAITSVRPHSKERNIEKDENKWTVSGTKRDLADNQSDPSQTGPISKRMRNDRPSRLPSDSGHAGEQLSLGDRGDKNPYLRDANRLNATNRFEQNTSLNSQITNISDQTYRIPSVWEGQSSTRDKTDGSNFRNSELTDRAKSQNLRYNDDANREPKFERVQTSLFDSRKIGNVPLTVDYGHKSGVKNVQMTSNKIQYSPARDDNPYLRGDSPVRHADSNKSRSTNWPNRLNRDDESNRKVGNAPLHNREQEPVERSWSGTREAYPKAITKDWQHGSTPRDLTYGRQAGGFSASSRFNDFPSSARMDYPPSDFYGRSSDMRASHLPPPSSGGPPRSSYPDVHGPLIGGASLGRSSLFAPSQSAKLVINNLPSQVNKRDISELCGRYGVVRDIDHDTRAFKSRVVFANAQDARIAARELNDFVYRGSTLRALVV